MKKLLTLAVLLGAASMSFGQGYISFSGGATATTRVSTNGVAVAGSATLPVWYYALFANTSAASSGSMATGLDPTANGWVVVGYGTNTALAGRLNGNNTADAAVQLNSPFTGVGATADFAIAGWSANIGSTWGEVQAFFNNQAALNQASHDAGSRNGVGGWFGIAGLTADNIPLAANGGPYNGLFGTAPGLIQGFSLGQIVPVPEPSTIALAGLGAAALVIFRRRKV